MTIWFTFHEMHCWEHPNSVIELLPVKHEVFLGVFTPLSVLSLLTGLSGWPEYRGWGWVGLGEDHRKWQAAPRSCIRRRSLARVASWRPWLFHCSLSPRTPHQSFCKHLKIWGKWDFWWTGYIHFSQLLRTPAKRQADWGQRRAGLVYIWEDGHEHCKSRSRVI